ncbi:sodium-dependent glucose transporter 1A isoform X2 [Parasteatoda tepidariorum]|nr:sodium-dependent glucose transporter 1A isoform X2 [Parasteatoda tepidariorum]
MCEISSLLLRQLRTVLIYLSMICLGMCTAIPGPTLLDLQRNVHSETNEISKVYIGRSIGYLLGSFFGGVLLDRLQKPQLLMFLFSFIMSVCTAAIPWSDDLLLLVGIMAFSGCAMGALDTGLNVWCLDLWNDESSPFFQALHFFFGLGAFVAPIIAAPFLSHNDHNDLNSTLSSFNQSSSPLDFSDYEKANVIYIYSIIGAISLFVSLMFMFLFLTSVKLNSSDEMQKYKDPKVRFKISILLCAFLLICVYCGLEIGFGQMIAIYAVRSTHKFTESLASYFTSVFWGTFTFARGISIVLAVKFSPFVIIACDCSLMFFAATLLVLFGNTYETFLWIGTGALGVGFASFYPSTITWVEQYVNIDNKIGSYFVVAASVGEMVAPLTISQFVNTKPEFLFYATITCVSLCAMFIIILRIITTHVGLKIPITTEICSPTELLESEKQCDEKGTIGERETLTKV